MSSLQTSLLILGASGDLSKRLLLPGLATLLEVKDDWDVQLVGAGVEDISDADWKAQVRTSFENAQASKNEEDEGATTAARSSAGGSSRSSRPRPTARRTSPTPTT